MRQDAEDRRASPSCRVEAYWLCQFAVQKGKAFLSALPGEGLETFSRPSKSQAGAEFLKALSRDGQGAKKTARRDEAGCRRPQGESLVSRRRGSTEVRMMGRPMVVLMPLIFAGCGFRLATRHFPWCSCHNL
jgi:hypothetical protein